MVLLVYIDFFYLGIENNLLPFILPFKCQFFFLTMCLTLKFRGTRSSVSILYKIEP